MNVVISTHQREEVEAATFGKFLPMPPGAMAYVHRKADDSFALPEHLVPRLVPIIGLVRGPAHSDRAYIDEGGFALNDVVGLVVPTPWGWQFVTGPAMPPLNLSATTEARTMAEIAAHLRQHEDGAAG